MDIDEIANRHYSWLERVGWNNKTPLESLALIASEVGEAINECRGAKPTEKLSEELADIIIRTAGFACSEGIDIGAAIDAKLKKNESLGTRGRIK